MFFFYGGANAFTSKMENRKFLGYGNGEILENLLLEISIQKFNIKGQNIIRKELTYNI